MENICPYIEWMNGYALPNTFTTDQNCDLPLFCLPPEIFTKIMTQLCTLNQARLSMTCKIAHESLYCSCCFTSPCKREHTICKDAQCPDYQKHEKVDVPHWLLVGRDVDASLMKRIRRFVNITAPGYSTEIISYEIDRIIKSSKS
jgi:hypothetical protein